jgi:HAD domain in Swiss Army Knife RNA repair proteins
MSLGPGSKQLDEAKHEWFYVFLDFDGVVHPDHVMDFSNIEAVEEGLRQANQLIDGKLKIIISSAWRYTHSLESMQRHFSKDIAEKMVGVTKDHSYGFDKGGREKEIESWIETHDKGAPWVAIDDRKVMFRPNTNRLILCNGSVGFEEENQKSLLKLVSQSKKELI